jgi:hypothetical protein
MTAWEKTRRIADDLDRAEIYLPFETVNTLRRIERTLHRWAEDECNGRVQRDDDTGRPYYHYNIRGTKYPAPDREKGALKRVAAICKTYKLYYFHQGDPRGCALYISREKLEETGYHSRGVAICV